jgi:hypothetical protein
MRSTLFVLTLLLAGPAYAQAQPTFKAQSVRKRAFTHHTFSGLLPPEARGIKGLSAFLSRGGADRLGPLELEVKKGARAEVRLTTAKLLPPASYVLTFESGDTQHGTAKVLVGSAADVQSSSGRLDAWYRGALSTFRDLCASLERRGAFHAALAPAKPKGHLYEFQEDFLVRSWEPALVGARMDLSIFRRRLLLPPRPGLLAGLEKLAQILTARRTEWRACVVDRGGKNPPDPKVLKKGVLSVLEAAGKLPASPESAWAAGALAKVPVAPQAGQTFKSPLGFQLNIPANAEVITTINPIERVCFRLKGTLVRVHVRDLPDDATPKALIRRLELGARESWDSYKRLASSGPLPNGAGLLLDFRARFLNRRTKTSRTRLIHQRTLFPAGGRRTLTLLFQRPNTAQGLSKALKLLEASFTVIP